MYSIKEKRSFFNVIVTHSKEQHFCLVALGPNMRADLAPLEGWPEDWPNHDGWSRIIQMIIGHVSLSKNRPGGSALPSLRVDHVLSMRIDLESHIYYKI